MIGKINQSKLANYLGIDIFCLVACPENSLIDSKVCLSLSPSLPPSHSVCVRVCVCVCGGGVEGCACVCV